MNGKICGAILFLLVGVSSFGQQLYDKSAGVRLGYTSGFTFKKFIETDESIEVMLSGRKSGIQITTLYAFNRPMQFSFNENFYVYYGMGGHFGLERHRNLDKELILDGGGGEPTSQNVEKSYFTIGADAIVGIEYRWLSVPVTIGFDVKPFFNYIGFRHVRGNFWDSAISFKYVF